MNAERFLGLAGALIGELGDAGEVGDTLGEHLGRDRDDVLDASACFFHQGGSTKFPDDYQDLAVREFSPIVPVKKIPTNKKVEK